MFANGKTLYGVFFLRYERGKTVRSKTKTKTTFNAPAYLYVLTDQDGKKLKQSFLTENEAHTKNRILKSCSFQWIKELDEEKEE